VHLNRAVFHLSAPQQKRGEIPLVEEYSSYSVATTFRRSTRPLGAITSGETLEIQITATLLFRSLDFYLSFLARYQPWGKTKYPEASYLVFATTNYSIRGIPEARCRHTAFSQKVLWLELVMSREYVHQNFPLLKFCEGSSGGVELKQ